MEAAAWFTGRLPDDWFIGPTEVAADRDEVVVVGELEDVELASGATEAQLEEARLGRIKRFREETRGVRMRIAAEAQRRYRRKVAWGARCGGVERTFTNLSVPVMTRLRMPERRVLDTLIEAGVARSRSEALAWCVALVGKNESEWIGELRDALVQVREVRAGGPSVA
jgi:hypothetical protein